MAVYTPRGLKIRLSIQHCFTLIARLRPNIDAFKLLQRIEGMDDIINFIPFVMGVICFIFKLEYLYIGLYVMLAVLLANLINLYGLYIIPGLIKASLGFSYFSGYYLHYVVLAILGFVMMGWRGIVAFVLGRIIGGFIFFTFNMVYSKHQFNKYGVHFGITEREFFNAYRMYASKFNVTTNIDLSNEEMESEDWNEAFYEYMQKCPGAASKCSD